MTDIPYYLPVADEIDIFTAAYACRLPVLLKGPTGCGKTRFVEYMAYTLRGANQNGAPVVNGAYYVVVTLSDNTRLRRRLLVAR